MRRLLRAEIRAVESLRSDCLSFDMHPIQLGLGASPWRVAVCSMLLCRSRYQQVLPVVQELFRRWPTAAALARADDGELESAIRSLGLYRNRRRQLQRFSSLYTGDSWAELMDLPGVGVYVADAVGIVCFGDTALESGDTALKAYAAHLVGASVLSRTIRG